MQKQRCIWISQIWNRAAGVLSHTEWWRERESVCERKAIGYDGCSTCNIVCNSNNIMLPYHSWRHQTKRTVCAAHAAHLHTHIRTQSIRMGPGMHHTCQFRIVERKHSNMSHECQWYLFPILLYFKFFPYINSGFFFIFIFCILILLYIHFISIHFRLDLVSESQQQQQQQQQKSKRNLFVLIFFFVLPFSRVSQSAFFYFHPFDCFSRCGMRTFDDWMRQYIRLSTIYFI